MSNQKECKECPWLKNNVSNNNKVIKEHSIRYNKGHNCHMRIKGKQIGLWDVNKGHICKGLSKINNTLDNS